MTQEAMPLSADTEIVCSIIIPTKDKLEYLQPCVEGVLASCAGKPIEIIVVDNNSETPEALAYLEQLNQKATCRVLKYADKFNFSAINNFAVAECQGEMLCFLNNDIEIIQDDWLDKLLEVAQHTEVGAVGCLLQYPDARVQHAGIALDEFAIARHIAHLETVSDLQALELPTVIAVEAATAACLVVRRSLFERVGGFDAEQLSISFNDVDLCLRLRDKGLPVLLHTGVCLIHHESVSRHSDRLPKNRGRALQEHSYMQFRWRHLLVEQTRSVENLAYLQSLTIDSSDTPTIIASAKDALFQQRHFSDKAISGGRPSTGNANSGESYWHDQYQSLETRYQELEQHSERVEHAHAMIESSIFWRMTEPLRKLRDKFSGSASTTVQQSGEANNADIESQQDSKPEEDFKLSYDRQAEEELQRFLAGKESLEFDPGDAPQITIVLVLYNRAALTLLCLRSLLEHGDVPFQLVMVDNQSSDDTGALLDRVQGATIVRNVSNLGFVLAVNQGAAKATADTILLLNNDAVIEENALGNALATLNSDASIGAVGGKIKLLDGHLQEAGSLIWNDGACLGYGRTADPLAPEYMFQRDVDYCSGAFLLFSRQTFTELGGFDEAYAPAYYEESDFCVRLHERGLRVVYDPTVQISHYEFASSGGLKGASTLQAEHRKILCNKHPDYLQARADNNPDNVLWGRIANDYPNVLIIDDRVPHPSLGAGYPRCCHILNSLADMQLNVGFFPLLYPNDNWQQVYQSLSRKIEVLLNRGEAQLRKLLEERRGYYQIIMVSRVHNMEVFNRIVSKDPTLLSGVRVIYDAEAVVAPREANRRRLFGAEVSAQAEQEMVQDELAIAKPAKQIVAVSENEARLFREQGFSDTTVLGHISHPIDNPAPFDRRSGLLFVGALRDDGSPNVDSLLWFIVNVLPLIRTAIPDIELTVVGDNFATALAAIELDNVTFTGRIDNIDIYYDAARVFIAPTRFAAGIPHKVHEAAGKGIPSVVKPLLAEQLGWEDGIELLSAESAEEFAAACTRLHTDETLWNSLQANGFAAIERDCSETQFTNALQELFGRETAG